MQQTGWQETDKSHTHVMPHVHRLLFLQTSICMSDGTSHASANWANQQLNQLLLFQQDSIVNKSHSDDLGIKQHCP